MKKAIRLVLVLAILLCAALPVNATSYWIVDDAGLLTEDEITVLDAFAARLVNDYGMDVVILTVESLEGKSSEAFADDYFDDNGYGYGENASGVLLLLSMEYRDWAISTSGDCIRIFSDRQLDNIF